MEKVARIEINLAVHDVERRRRCVAIRAMLEHGAFYAGRRRHEASAGR